MVTTCLQAKALDRGPEAGHSELDTSGGDASFPLRFPFDPSMGFFWPGNNYNNYVDGENLGAWHNGWILSDGFGFNGFPPGAGERRPDPVRRRQPRVQVRHRLPGHEVGGRERPDVFHERLGLRLLQPVRLRRRRRPGRRQLLTHPQRRHLAGQPALVRADDPWSRLHVRRLQLAQAELPGSGRRGTHADRDHERRRPDPSHGLRRGQLPGPRHRRRRDEGHGLLPEGPLHRRRPLDLQHRRARRDPGRLERRSSQGGGRHLRRPPLQRDLRREGGRPAAVHRQLGPVPRHAEPGLDRRRRRRVGRHARPVERLRGLRGLAVLRPDRGDRLLSVTGPVGHEANRHGRRADSRLQLRLEHPGAGPDVGRGSSLPRRRDVGRGLRDLGPQTSIPTTGKT